MDQEYKEEILALLHELLANLKDPQIKNKIKELVLWEVELTNEISGPQQIDPGNILQAIDKIVGWVKDIIRRKSLGSDEQIDSLGKNRQSRNPQKRGIR